MLQALAGRGRPERLEGGLQGYRGGIMQDLGYELPRIPIPRTSVNKGKKRGPTLLCPGPLLRLVTLPWPALGRRAIRPVTLPRSIRVLNRTFEQTNQTNVYSLGPQCPRMLRNILQLRGPWALRPRLTRGLFFRSPPGSSTPFCRSGSTFVVGCPFLRFTLGIGGPSERPAPCRESQGPNSRCVLYGTRNE